MQTSNHNGFANRRLQAYCITPFCLRYWNQNISPRRFSVTLEMVYSLYTVFQKHTTMFSTCIICADSWRFTIYFTAVLQTTVWTTYTYTRQIENQQVPRSLDTEVTLSPYLQYTSNLTKDISSLVYCLTMFDVCHMFVLKYLGLFLIHFNLFNCL